MISLEISCWKQPRANESSIIFIEQPKTDLIVTEIFSTWGHSLCMCVWVCIKDLVKWLLEPEGYLQAFVVCFGKSNTSGICSLAGYLHRYWGQWCVIQTNTSALKSCTSPSSLAPAALPQICVSASVWGKISRAWNNRTATQTNLLLEGVCVCDASEWRGCGVI